MRLSQNNFTKPLSLSLEPSNSVRWGITILHLFVASIIMIASNSLAITTLSLLLVLGSYLYYYRWYIALTFVKSIVRVNLSSQGSWSLINSQHKRIKVTLQPTSFLSQHLLVLNFHSSEVKKYTVLIPKASVNANDFRQLKVRLKTKGWNK